LRYQLLPGSVIQRPVLAAAPLWWPAVMPRIHSGIAVPARRASGHTKGRLAPTPHREAAQQLAFPIHTMLTVLDKVLGPLELLAVRPVSDPTPQPPLPLSNDCVSFMLLKSGWHRLRHGARIDRRSPASRQPAPRVVTAVKKLKVRTSKSASHMQRLVVAVHIATKGQPTGQPWVVGSLSYLLPVSQSVTFSSKVACHAAR
jgi:hypothetical protein